QHLARGSSVSSRGKAGPHGVDMRFTAINLLFLYMHIRKEAVLSSQIEGTQSTLSDLLRFETEAIAGRPFDDMVEVSNYVDAMMHGLARLPNFRQSDADWVAGC